MSLIEIAVRRRVTVIMFTAALLLFGLVSLARLPVNLLPDLSYPTVTVRTELAGAAPVEIENLLTRPIEEATGVVRNLRSIRSVSRAGQSDVILQFAWGTDMDFTGIEVRERIDLLQLPQDATRPVLLRFDPASEPIMRMALIDASPDTSVERLKSLRRFADDRLKPAFESIIGAAAVKVSGGYEDEIQVRVDQQRLAQLNLDIGTIAARLGAENVNLSGGRLEQGSERFLVRTVNEFESVEAMANAVIATVEDRPVYLKDIAAVTRAYRDRTAITRFDGRECIELALYKEGDANTVALARDVRERLESLSAGLPRDSSIRVVNDQSTFIRSAVSEVGDAALIGGVLAVLVLFLFLRQAQATFVAAVVIPVTVVGIFVLMYGFNISLNVMSLGGIALSVGMLIDNSVVILEAITRYREAGKPAHTAALEGTREVAMAVTASTLTTIAVFLPLVFVTGIAGQLFRDQALTIVFAQVLSLIISLTVVPMLASLRASPLAASELPRDYASGLRESAKQVAIASVSVIHAFRLSALLGQWPSGLAARIRYTLSLPLRALALLLLRLGAATAQLLGAVLGLLLSPALLLTARSFGRLQTVYPSVLRKAMQHRAAVIALSSVALLATFAIATQLGTELIPQLQQGEFTAKLRLGAGTPLERTDRVARALQQATTALPGVERTYAVAGSGNRLDATPVDSGENTAELNIKLLSPAKEDAEMQVQAAVGRELDAVPGVSYEFARPALLSLATPLEVIFSGYDLPQLDAAAQRVEEQLRSRSEFAEVRSTVEQGHPEIQISFDQERAAHLSLPVRSLADSTVNSVRGTLATRYRLRDKQIDVLVKALDTRDSSIDDIRAIVVNPGAERPVTLDAVADVRLALGPAEIRRAEQERVAIVSATASDGDLGHAVNVARQILSAAPLAPGVSVSVRGQSEEMRDSFASLALAFGLAVFLVYLVMASQFESLTHPLVVLLTVPMGLIGAFWALAITATTINAVALIGLILLAGIVVNNAIVLVDAINQARRAGQQLHDAILFAARQRLRPIVITSISTILGLVPMAIGLGEGAEVRRPMAITVIGGMLIATAMTLIVIPVLYSLLGAREKSREPAGEAVTES
ncbi:MAG: efflux RND transporter permease subunit [Steroidobacteraceae bacterium]